MTIRNILHVSFIGLAVFAAAACGKKAPAPAQTPPPAAVTAEPADAEEKPQAQNPYEGSWDGNAEPDRPLNFTVEGGKVTYFFANYGGSNGSCSFNGGFSLDGAFPINGTTFTATGKSSGSDIEGTATGTFTSSNEISGTIAWKGDSGMCGPFDIKTNWKAKRSAE
jgi:predicted small lipoprotein YifL